MQSSSISIADLFVLDVRVLYVANITQGSRNWFDRKVRRGARAVTILPMQSGPALVSSQRGGAPTSVPLATLQIVG
jgi:hypothetical protein